MIPGRTVCDPREQHDCEPCCAACKLVRCAGCDVMVDPADGEERCASCRDDPPVKKARKKSKTSPTQRTLAYARKRGWLANVTERWNPHAFVRQDLFGFCDVLVLDGRPGALAIQATSGGTGGGSSARERKLEGLDAVRRWLAAGLRLEVWGWRKAGEKGARKLWALRRVKAELVDGVVRWDEVSDA